MFQLTTQELNTQTTNQEIIMTERDPIKPRNHTLYFITLSLIIGLLTVASIAQA